MNTGKKFLFETTFDADAELHSRGGANRGALYREEDLAAAREEALAQGRTAGFRDAEASIENRAAQTLAHIREQLAVADRSLAATLDGVKRDAVEVARTVMGKALPGLVRREGFGEIEALVSDCLENALSEPRIVVRVHDSVLDALKARIDSLAERSGYDGKIVLMVDDALGQDDCRVEWADGGAERNVEQLWNEIEGAIQRFLASLKAPGPTRAGPMAAPAPQGDGAAPDGGNGMRIPTAGAGPAAAEQSSTDAPPGSASPEAAADAVTTD